jgi:phosphoglycerate dehydrogenase-like enzyme
MSLRIFVDIAAPAEALRLLQEASAGHHLMFPEAPAASVLHQSGWDPQLATADVAFGQPDPTAIANARQLKWIHVSSSSITRYDTLEFRAQVAKHGIQVTNSASVYSEACAYHALAFMLAQSRQLPLGLNTRVAGGTEPWHRLRSSCVPLRGQTVLILGYGAIGQRLTQFLAPFEMQIFAYRRAARGDEGIPVIAPAELPRTLAEADHVVNILPDSSETRGFFDAARFSTMKPGAVFCNIGRGTTVAQDALLKALRSGHIKAAWLDVTEPEPLPKDHPLLTAPNCFITPHVAGGHLDESKTLIRHFLANLTRFVRGEALLDRVM